MSENIGELGKKSNDWRWLRLDSAQRKYGHKRRKGMSGGGAKREGEAAVCGISCIAGLSI